MPLGVGVRSCPGGQGRGLSSGDSGRSHCRTVDQGRLLGTPLGLVEAIGHAAPRTREGRGAWRGGFVHLAAGAAALNPPRVASY
jgi:hypothetical protein